jgi:hypothetical protein
MELKMEKSVKFLEKSGKMAPPRYLHKDHGEDFWMISKRLSLFQTVKKFPFPNCQNVPFQTFKISFSKLSKCPFLNCQNFPFQTVKNFLSKLSKFPFPKTNKKFIKKLKLTQITATLTLKTP